MSTVNLELPLDFSYLYEISDNDRDFIKEMLETIVKNTPSNMEEINLAYEQKKWEEIGRLVHKLKPSLLLLNIGPISTLIKSLESNAKGQKNLDSIDTQIAELNEFCDVILSEINGALSSDSY